MEIRRRLAETRPDAFLPELATSMGAKSRNLAAHDRHVEAAQAAHEALEILAPFIERYPDAYGELAVNIAKDVQRYGEAAEQAPNKALLDRVARALGGPGEDDAAN